MRSFLFVIFMLSSPFMHAVEENSTLQEQEAAKNLLRFCSKAGLFVGDLQNIVHFIEHKFHSYVQDYGYYLPKEITKLSQDIEYDVETKLFFIHLNQVIGKGGQKIVKKSILYDVKNPKIVATATAIRQIQIQLEIKILKKLQHIDRVLHLVAAPETKIGNSITYTMITSFYEGGSVASLAKKRNFSIREKISLAKDLMDAVKGVHNAGFCHGDIHDDHLLLESNKDKSLQGVRHRAVLVDFGTSVSLEPKNEFFRRQDLYSSGATLYGLLHNVGYQAGLFNKIAKLKSMCKQLALLQKNPNDLLVGEISQELTLRLKTLEQANKTGSLSAKDQFERLILQMLHPKSIDPRDASYWYSEFEKLLQRA